MYVMEQRSSKHSNIYLACNFMTVLLSPILMVSSHLVTDNNRECAKYGFCFPFLTFSFFYLMQFFHQHISFHCVRLFLYILILSNDLEHNSSSKHTIASNTEKAHSVFEPSCCLCKTSQHIYNQM